MSFSDLRTLGSGNTYSKLSHSNISVSTKNTNDVYASRNPERTEEPNNRMVH